MNQILFIIKPFIFSRLICGSFVYIAHAHREYLRPVPGGWEGVKNWWINPWTTYDSEWFISIAKGGYQEHTTPFFPLYSLLLRLGGETEAGMAIAGVLISNICFFLSLYVLYLLTEMDYGKEAAKTAVWLLAFFPTTAFFSAVYTESLFLLLLLCCFYSARNQRWLLAGAIGFFSALVRNPGVLIFIALWVEYLSSNNYSWRRLKIREMLSVSSPLLAFGAVQIFFWAKFKNPLAGISSQEFYYRKAGWPWESIGKDFLDLLRIESIDAITFISLSCTLLIFFLIFEHRQIIRPSYFVLLLGVTLMHLCYPRTIPPYTIGSVRYMSTTFPFIQVLSFSFSQLSSNSLCNQLTKAMYILVCIIFSYFFGMKIFLG